MQPDFRKIAREHLTNAKKNLEEGGVRCTVYAVLDVRLAIEAMTYDRASLYEDELPVKEIETWQPPKLVKELNEIDPYAHGPFKLSIALDKNSGEMTSMGEEKTLSPATIKKHYHALGNYLHVPTLRQLKRDRPRNYEKIRKKCGAIIEEIDEVLASKLFHFRLNLTASMDCEQCGNTIKRQFIAEKGPRVVECRNCPASYKISSMGGEEVKWELLQHQVTCPRIDCKGSLKIWYRQIENGMGGICPNCQRGFQIGFSVKAYDFSDAEKVKLENMQFKNNTSERSK